jgi:leucyl aminopeptidase
MKIQFLNAGTTPQAGILVVPINQDALPANSEAVIVEAARQAKFTGKPGQLLESFVERDGKVVRLVYVGLGDASGKDRVTSAEKAGSAIVSRYLTSGETALTVDLSDSGLLVEQASALLLALRLRAWRWDTYRTTQTEDKKATLTDISVIGAPDGTEAQWEIEQAVATGVELTRELVTEPANVIYPVSFVERCRARMEGTGLKIRVLGEAEMAELGMGALLGVSQGSVRDAQLLVMEWNGGEQGGKPIAFVGKGVTFDTGGISIKGAAGMEDMKWDMGGAGAVAGTMLALALRKAKANVVAVCGLVENMPDGNAQRPGDVVKSLSGQTIEVINTDAEGRLVLCDALTWVQREYAPTRIVDLATLTGAIIAALAFEYAGLFSNDDALSADLTAAGETVGELLWRFPMGSNFDKMIDSPIADMKNVGGRYAGSITAAQFLKRYIENGTPWAHLDIAGMVWTDKPGTTWEKGASGYGVRLLDRFVRNTLEA